MTAAADNRRRVLVWCRYFVPATLAGGPIRSVSNVVRAFGDDFAFRVITSNTDIDQKPLSGVPVGQPVAWEAAQVTYVPPRRIATLTQAIRALRWRPQTVYFNGFFGQPFSFIPRLAFALLAPRDTRLVLAPRGEFSPLVLQQKPLKKRLFIALARLLGVDRRTIFQASTDLEKDEIIAALRVDPARVMVAGNMTAPAAEATSARPKTAGRLDAVFIARIHPKKGLLTAIEALRLCKTAIRFDVYGPGEDADYEARCRAAAAALPAGVSVNFCGALSNEQVAATLAGYDLFIMPTLGENFGHSIFEALNAGVPVAIGDTTPWRELEAEFAGFDLPVEDVKAFAAAFDAVAGFDQATMDTWRKGARARAVRWLESGDIRQRNRALLAGEG